MTSTSVDALKVIVGVVILRIVELYSNSTSSVL